MLASIYNKFRRITSNQLYFPEIDGIRFMAIVLVILFHTHGFFAGKSTGFPDTNMHDGWLNTFLEHGDRGVELFFVLSGFILCLPFAHQYINNGKKMMLKKYYLRRVTRLEPPYFIAMTAIFLMQVAMHVKPFDTLLPHWLASLAYSHALIYHHNPMVTVVAWSLEVEIQFYLIAPFLFRVLALHVTVRRIILLSGITLLIFFQTIYRPLFGSIYGFGQFFIVGILLADIYVSNTLAALFNKKAVVIAALACFVSICFMSPIKYTAAPQLGGFVYNISLTLLTGLLFYMILKNDLLKKIFSYKFIPIIGGMCYSIYLLHYTIISIFGRYTMRIHLTSYYLPNLLLQIILLTIPVLLISAVFYYYIERPFMSNKWMDMLIKKDKHQQEANMQEKTG
jgi:peptidoglycan/LPS O-acetylase OafA/YrhL